MKNAISRILMRLIEECFVGGVPIATTEIKLNRETSFQQNQCHVPH
jgi:hypothetical protein